MLDLKKYGINGEIEIIHNPSYQELYNAEMSPALAGYEKGEETTTGAVAVKTGVFTGRSPKDRYIVKDAISENTIWWDGKINRPVSVEIWNELKQVVADQLSSTKKLYVVDTFCGTNEKDRKSVV